MVTIHTVSEFYIFYLNSPVGRVNLSRMQNERRKKKIMEKDKIGMACRSVFVSLLEIRSLFSLVASCSRGATHFISFFNDILK
jgi:hypothetical protein